MTPISQLDLEASLAQVVSAWNQWMGPEYRMDERLLRQLTLDHPSWEPNLSAAAWDGGELVGMRLARRHGSDWILDCLAVAPGHRGRGLGRALLEDLPEGPIRFGGGPAHFVPGLPEGWQARGFFEHLGFVADWVAEDLHLVLQPRPEDFEVCRPSDREEVLKMVGGEFSQRWHDDTLARFEAGDAGDVVIIRREGLPVAFCHAWHYQSRLLGPSVFWIRHSAERFGGIGPVGVAASQRGLGLGRRVVEEALNYLHSRSVEQVVVDWTSIGPFYEKCGFRSWRRYRGLRRGE